MKQLNLKKLSFPLLIFLICTAFIIHSCKKDNKPAAIATPTINQAKEWYEATYSTPTVRATVQVNRSGPTAGKAVFDYSKFIKPDWQHGVRIPGLMLRWWNCPSTRPHLKLLHHLAIHQMAIIYTRPGIVEVRSLY